MTTTDATTVRAQLKGLIFRDLLAAVLRYRAVTAASFALMILAKLSAVAIPLTLKHIVDELSHPESPAVFPVFLVLAYALLRFFADALNEARDVVFSAVTQRTVAEFAQRTFGHLHRLGARFHARRETGAIVRDVQKGTEGIGFLLGTALFSIVPTFIEIGTIVAIVMRNYSGTFTIIIAATFACYAICTYIFTRRRLVVQRRVNAIEAQSDGRLVDSLLNYDTVKFFATEDTETWRLSEVLAHWIDARIANQRALTALHVGQSGVIATGIAAVVLLAVQHVITGAMSVGDLVLINAYIIQVCMPLNTLGFVFRETNDAKVNVERMFAILVARGVPGEDIDVPDAQALAVTDGAIEFEHVNFAYDPARLVLRDVTFRVHPGHRLAVVGGSGSGKSTLVRLLFRIYQPTSGRVLIDGQDLRAVTQKSLREAIGIVPQDTVLFNDTIAYNIAYGRQGATRADVVRAARAAQLDEFVERLPDHYDTRVGERGVRLSGGERQRIAIARAILKNPRIIVFDEATSALDTRSERAIQTELNRLARGRTSISIAHRLSTVVDADWILVMEHGRIVEQGTHDELLARNAVYARMWALQWQQGELEHWQRKVSAEPVRIGSLIADALSPLQSAIAQRRITWRTIVPPEDLRITGDPVELQQALGVLCQSEIDQTRIGGLIELRVEHQGNHAWISVVGTHDKSVELSQEAARMIEAKLTASGGSLTVMPVGSRIAYVMVLPLRPVLDDDAARAQTEAPSGVQPIHDDAQAPLNGLRVLAIDDQEDARDALEAVLSASGAHVQLAASGDEALAELAKASAHEWPQIVLCDIVLGAEDGYQVLERIRDFEARHALPTQKRMPAIALTGYTHPDDQDRARRAGFSMHLSKPVPAPALIDAILEVAGKEGR
ncbi:ATP-binding cassette domain-containing protein [Paraburkholderia sp. LEh10]|uniref:ATP-binding cassette domain-containing protein n=1 Tax=Paraburkholderia sp. LEh10 TaxID=2821353 RepID=UPI001AE14623|nr:ATP-binding cassette domain-containing protein [Paraburkholderia sp. LEh10]MBP0590290.1 ATP-binding cassette domain-containing protein [Paraburkholderia sp. LEh10]